MRVIVFFLVLLVSTTGFAGDQKMEILKSFEAYRAAILNRNGERAYSLVDANTKSYYAKVIDWVQALPSNETRELSLINRMIVLMARHRIETLKLVRMDGHSFFVYAVNNGWIGEGNVMNMRLKVVEVQNDIAKTHILTPQRESSFGFTFRRDPGGWLIDLTSMLPISEQAFENQIESVGIEENKFIFSMLEMLSGTKVDESVWEPVGR